MKKTLLQETNHMRHLMGLEKLNEGDRGEKVKSVVKNVFNNLKEKFKKKKGQSISKENIIQDVKLTQEEIIKQLPAEYRENYKTIMDNEMKTVITILNNDNWDDTQLNKEQTKIYNWIYGVNGKLIQNFHNLISKVNEEEPGLLGGYLDNVLEDEIEELSLRESKTFINEGELLNKLMQRMVQRNVIKKRGSQIQKGSKQVKAGEKDLIQLAKTMKTTNLGSYKDQLKAFVLPLTQLDAHSYLMNQKDCDNINKGSAGGTNQRGGSIENALKPTYGAIDDLIARMYMDMKMELSNMGLLKGEEEKAFTPQTAIEMLYARYKNQKSLLERVAQGIIKITGMSGISGQMLNAVQKYIRSKYGSTQGGLLNSILLDFIGGVAQVQPDYSLTQC